MFFFNLSLAHRYHTILLLIFLPLSVTKLYHRQLSFSKPFSNVHFIAKGKKNNGVITCPELLVTATIKASSTYCFSPAVVFSTSSFISPNTDLFRYIRKIKKRKKEKKKTERKKKRKRRAITKF